MVIITVDQIVVVFLFHVSFRNQKEKKNDDGILYIQLGVSGRRRKTFGEKKKEGN